jgi:hypothetical protein
MPKLSYTLSASFFCFAFLVNPALAQNVKVLKDVDVKGVVKEIQRLSNAERVLLQGATDDEAVAVLLPMLVDRCSEIAEESGSPHFFGMNKDGFQEEATSLLLNIVQTYLNVDSLRERREETYALLERVTDRRFAEIIVGQWLSIGKPRLSDLMEIENFGEFPSNGLITAESSGEGLTLDTKNIIVVRDSGGPGAGNGVIDSGEWVEFKFSLKNDTPVPWFSTSAVARANHPCVFVPKGREQVLSEMTPGESGSVNAKVYVAKTCPDSEASFQIAVADTWQTEKEPQIITMSFRPSDTSRFRLLPKTLDSDHPGSSDGNGGNRLMSGRAHEFSLGAESSEQMLLGSMAVGFGSRDRGLFESVDIRSLPLHVSLPGQFSPSDDLELKLKEGRAFFEKFRDRTEDSRWFSMDEGRTSVVWLAVDTVLAREFPIVKSEANEEAGESVKTKSQESEDRVPVAQVMEWVQTFTELVPRPAEPKSEGAIDSTDGYEVVFESKAFQEAYGQWGAVEEVPENETPESGRLTYRYRSFVPIQIQAPKHVLGCTDRSALNYQKNATKDDGGCRYPPFYKRLDLGVGWSSLPAIRPTPLGETSQTVVWSGDTVSTTGGQVRFSAGNRWRVMGAMEYERVGASSYSQTADLKGSRFGVDVGFGKPFNLITQKLELEALAKVGLDSVRFTGLLEKELPFSEVGGGATVGFHGGLELRLIARIMSNVGLYAGAAVETGRAVSVPTGFGSVDLVSSDSISSGEFGLSVFFD